MNAPSPKDDGTAAGEAHTTRWFDASTIDGCPWSDTDQARWVRRYWQPFVQQGAARFIRNVATTPLLLQVDDVFLPVTVNPGGEDTCYVCSPFAHYVTYAIEELRELKSPRLERMLAWVLRALGLFLRWGDIDRVVHVNNALLSTNLYPRLSATQVQAVADAVRARFPDHAVVFRSLNPTTCAAWMEHLRAAGAALVPSRQVYLFPGLDEGSLSREEQRQVRRDRSLWERSGYAVRPGESFTPEELDRGINLYGQLYLEKYSTLNPQFTVAWLNEVSTSGAMGVLGISRDGRMDGILGFFQVEGVQTTPLFGYDIGAPRERGLYRMLSSLTLDAAFDASCLAHASSGAASFKENRGHRSAIEYSAVLTSHLVWRRRLVWRLLQALMEKVAVPLLRKHQL